MALGNGLFAFACLALTTLSSVHAVLPDGRLKANQPRIPTIPTIDIDFETPVVSRKGDILPPYNTTYYFDQLIDHENPSKGTFKQRYWHTAEFYEKGGCIVLMTPGEVNAARYSGYLTNRTINGLIAQQEHCAVVLIEHRFYGESNPYPDLTVQSLRLHTIQQAIEDLDYFTKTAVLPMTGGDAVTPDRTPWILTGGSYAGALTSWARQTWWAGYSSSGVVESIVDFWRYFKPIRENMPKNCSTDVQAVIGYVDNVFSKKNQTEINRVKNLFGLDLLTHLDDVAGALRNNLWDWQSLQLTTGAGATFYQFCDALEVKNGVSASAKGWGLEHALPAWAAFFSGDYLSRLCGSSNIEDCLGTYDPTQSVWTDTSVDNAWRSWFWIVCNEVGFLQEGAPKGYPSVVTRLVQPAYDERQCSYMFPDAFASPPSINVAKTNSAYNGWNVKLRRQFFANGHRDPWREATVSAETQHIRSTTTQPIAIGDGFHCSDLSTSSGTTNPTIAQVQSQALNSFKAWLAEWKITNPYKRDASAVEAKPVNAFVKGSGRF